MGGIGSGTGYRFLRSRSKPIADVDLLRLDMRYINRQGWLRAGNYVSIQWSCGGEPSGNINMQIGEGDPPSQILLIYTYTNSLERTKTDIRERVEVEWQPCRFGGMRPWFRCPRCGTRAAVLWGGKRFLCRTCNRLSYPSQNETQADRAIRRSRKVRKKLGLDDDVFFPVAYAAKPKGMRWATYERLVNEGQEADLIWCWETTRRFGFSAIDGLDLPWPD